MALLNEASRKLDRMKGRKNRFGKYSLGAINRKVGNSRKRLNILGSLK